MEFDAVLATGGLLAFALLVARCRLLGCALAVAFVGIAAPTLAFVVAFELTFAADPFVAACCPGCDEAAGAAVAAGAGALASRRAAKGCELVCWLVAVVCKRCDASDSLTLTSDVILGALDTAALPETA